jgi:hypothetical protein
MKAEGWAPISWNK